MILLPPMKARLLPNLQFDRYMEIEPDKFDSHIKIDNMCILRYHINNE